MKCPKCGSENVTVQVVNETELKEKKHGFLFLFFPALIVKIFAPKKYKTVNHQKKIAVCHECGKSWKVK